MGVIPVRRLLSVTSVLIALTAGPAGALTVTVDWTGAEDYLTLPEGMANAGPADTVLIAPGVYAVGGAGWPIVLNAMSPNIVGRDGAEVIDADELASLDATISWDVLAGISARVPRLYLQGGEVVATTTLVDRNPEP